MLVDNVPMLIKIQFTCALVLAMWLVSTNSPKLKSLGNEQQALCVFVVRWSSDTELVMNRKECLLKQSTYKLISRQIWDESNKSILS